MKQYVQLMAGTLAFCAACVDPDPEMSVAAFEIGPDDGGYDIQPQGRWLIGSQLDGPPFSGPDFHFNVSTLATKAGRPIVLSVVNDAALQAGLHRGADPWFDGVIVSNGTIELQLTAPKGTDNITTFRLMRRSTGPSFDTDACGPEGIDAIPLAGVFRTDGLHLEQPGRITFACGDAVARKCAHWGYPAGPVPGLLWDAHQACTRMARADYGANGTSHTRMETAIKIADAVPGVNDLPIAAMFGDVTTWPPDPSKFFFEAAWWPGTHKAGCLSKLRWHSLPMGGYPGLDLPDPRIDPLAKNCEDMVLDDLLDAGALTFVGSAYNDLVLETWHAATPGGPDYVTTIRGYHAQLEDRVLRPFRDYHTYYYDNNIGFLLRKVPGSITDPSELVEVHMYREIAYDRMVLARKNDPRFGAGYTQDPQREGFVFASQRPGTVPFRLYQHATTGDYLSTVDGAAPEDYVWVSSIGWIMGPELGAP